MSGGGTVSEVVVLFVDDEAKSRKYFARIFGRRYQVILAEDGVDALELALGSEDARIGVVVTDQIMPRMTGLDLLERLNEHNPHMVRVLSTAYTDSDLVSEAVTSRLIDYFIGKPWDIEKLEKILVQATEHYQHKLQGSSVA